MWTSAIRRADTRRGDRMPPRTAGATDKKPDKAFFSE